MGPEAKRRRRLALSGLAFALALVLPGTAPAWEFRADPICTIVHDRGAEGLRVTHDPALGLYAIHLTRAAPWPADPVFAIRFEGPGARTISTTRQALSEDARTLTVTDRGFGNVLDGLEFNDRMTASTGEGRMSLSLSGAGPAVRAFRACGADRLS